MNGTPSPMNGTPSPMNGYKPATDFERQVLRHFARIEACLVRLEAGRPEQDLTLGPEQVTMAASASYASRLEGPEESTLASFADSFHQSQDHEANGDVAGNSLDKADNRARAKEVSPSTPAGSHHCGLVNLAFSLRQCWKEGQKNTMTEHNMRTVMNWRRTHAEAAREQVVGAHLIPDPGSEAVEHPWYICPPSSLYKLTWDLTGMALILWDAVMIPFLLAFRPDDNFFLSFVSWFTLIFWTLDIFVTFATGIYVKGKPEVRFSRIAMAYLRGWFCMDLCVVGADWINSIMAMTGQGDGATSPLNMLRLGKVMRFLRMLRSMRLLRLVKLKRLMEDLYDRCRSEVVHMMFTIGSYSFIVILLSHIVACGWYGLSTALSEQGETAWVTHGYFSSPTRDSLGYRYITSLHWSLTQFTPASMEVMPQNPTERVFSVLILIFALIVFSSFVSSITAAMTKLRQINSAQDMELSLLRRFMNNNGIPRGLRARVMRYVEHRVLERSMVVPMKSVTLLQLLSGPLHLEVKYEMHAPTLCAHPLFKLMAKSDAAFVRRICHTALTTTCIASRDIVFASGNRTDKMGFVKKGELLYFPFNPQRPIDAEIGMDAAFARFTSQKSISSSVLEEAMPQLIDEGQWFAEAALWTEWVYFGTAVASTDSETLDVDAAKFKEAVFADRPLVMQISTYGAMFAANLNRREAITDLAEESPDKIAERVGAAFSEGNRSKTLTQLVTDEIEHESIGSIGLISGGSETGFRL